LLVPVADVGYIMFSN